MEWQDIILDPRKRHPFAKGELGYRYADVTYNAYDPEQRTFWGTINTARLDNDQEVVVPSGANFDYFPEVTGAVYLNHEYDAPIGVCATLQATPREIRARTRLSKSGLGDDVATMIEEGVLRGLSVGFKRSDAGPPTGDECKAYPGARTVCRTWKMVEYSVTAMPCNPDAVIDKKSMAVIDVQLGGIDDLLRAGRIHRKTAILCGLREAGKVMTGFTPAKPNLVQRAIEFVVTSGGTLTVG
jgi:HK97 family phage prohead protease